MGGDWDETKWTPAKLPTKELIDPVTPETPIFVSRYDGHMSLANSVALRLAGLTAKTPDPPGGVIVLHAKENPTCALTNPPQSLVHNVIPPPTHEQRITAANS